MTPSASNRDERVAERLREWGIVQVIGDMRGVELHDTWKVELDVGTGSVTHVKKRSSFSSECLDCGHSPHVSPDDATIAVCLRCGRDKWL